MEKSVVALLGPSGSGKSSIGQCIARKLDWDFLDSDREIEVLTGLSIAEIFRKNGEAAFRNLEKLFLENLVFSLGSGLSNLGKGIRSQLEAGAPSCEAVSSTAEAVSFVGQASSSTGEPKLEVASYRAGGCVLSTGGGMPIFNDNIALLQSFATLVYLTAPLEVLVTRIKTSENRPLLSGSETKRDEVTDNELILRLGKLIAERESIYNLARYRIDTSSSSPEQLADDIIEMAGLVSQPAAQGRIIHET